MDIDVVKIDMDNRRQVNRFMELPFRLYKGCPQWVPPLENDARLVFNRRRHPFYRHSEAAFFVIQGYSGQVAGRLAVLDNRRYNEYNREQTAFFYLFECEDDPALAQALFTAGIGWAQNRGLNKIVGPKGFTPFDGLGMLVKGFEHRPAFGLPYNLPYYPRLVEACGFEPAGELVSGYLCEQNVVFPEKIHRAAELLKKRRGLHVAEFRTRRDLRRLAPRLKDLYNGSLGETSGNVPLSDEDVAALANQLLWFADPRLIKIVMKDDEPVGFLFAYPDISAALQRTRGRLFPFGWVDMLLELRRTKWININGAGMVEGYRGLGGTALLFSEMFKTVSESHYRHADLVQIGTENDRMQRELRDLGIDFYKTHRLYQKQIG